MTTEDNKYRLITKCSIPLTTTTFLIANIAIVMIPITISRILLIMTSITIGTPSISPIVSLMSIMRSNRSIHSGSHDPSPCSSSSSCNYCSSEGINYFIFCAKRLRQKRYMITIIKCNTIKEVRPHHCEEAGGIFCGWQQSEKALSVMTNSSTFSQFPCFPAPPGQLAELF